MATKSYNTKDSERNWYLIDADGAILGRLATLAADILRGKKKATYTPNMDSGDNLVIINAAKVKLSDDRKKEGKVYFRHSGYPGGIKKETFKEAIEKHPEKVIYRAVTGMLPKNRMAKDQLKRLRVYGGSEHKHTQEITEINLKENK